ncbi:hypothetical protein CPB85DRAFT_1152564, partial [Mucidula mucida]
SIEEECGALGVMKVPDVLPAGANATDIRKCANHPFTLEDGGLARAHPRNPAFDTSLTRRAPDACVTDAPYGCSSRPTGKYCWKVCGNNGEWCWLANNFGVGSWTTCETYQDC